MADTIKDGLNQSNPNKLPSLTQSIKLGDVLASMVSPQSRARTGLASSTTQVHDRPALITAVAVGGSFRSIAPDGATLAAGQVSIAYDQTTYIPTLTFQAAVTQYEVQEIAPNLGTELAKSLA